jgi:putative transcriptional regulator
VGQQKTIQAAPRRKVLRLRQLRREREMTQAQLAERIGVGTSFISEIESGEVKPSLDNALALAKVFNCTVDELFEYVEVPA